MSPHLSDLLSALADGELSPHDEAAARLHLGECAACAAELHSITQVRDLVRGLPMLDSPIPVLVPRRRPVPALVAVAAAVVGVLGLAAVPRDRAVTPPVGRFVEVHATSGFTGDPLSELAPAAVPISFEPEP